jgi:murein DD-endopeptidase MepM/ murein hydrolase activator NlpD
MRFFRRRRFAGPVPLVLLALVSTVLACARADIPAVLPTAAPSPVPTRLPSPAPTLAPSPTPEPATPTPAAPEPVVSPTFPSTPTHDASEEPGTIVYTAQPGDTLRTLAIRFGVVPSDIVSPEGPIDGDNALIDIDQLLLIPRRLSSVGPIDRLIPDSEFVFSPNAADFDPNGVAVRQGGFLLRYQEAIGQTWRSGPQVVLLAARDNSVNPRILMALLEYDAGWVTNLSRPEGEAFKYALGHKDPTTQGLYRQLTWLANELGNGYYGWRAGTLTELRLADGTRIRLAPELNAGTVALQYYFSLSLDEAEWREAVGPNGFLATYTDLFGDPLAYYHPLYEPGLQQPEMILPFTQGATWAYTGGPHGAWEREAAWAALDFAPSSVLPGCVPSTEWVTAAAAGLVVRSENGLVVLDLDGDGREQTGWVLLYLHLEDAGRVPAGQLVEQGDRIGHPSCEGGIASGTHVHIARKYNGEWILADGALPFDLSGWVARAGSRPYQGALVRGDEIVLACPCATSETLISR